jgi:WD40 repeat protein
VRDAQWSRDGAALLSSSDDHTVRWWELAAAYQPRGELPVLAGDGWPMEELVLNRDKSLLLTAGDDGVARVWDATTGALRLTLAGHEDVIWRARWSPDERRIATASNDGTARIWDAQSGELLLTLTGHAGWSVDGVSWNADGTRLLTVSNDRTARVWNAKTGRSWECSDGTQPACAAGHGVRRWKLIPAPSF